MFLNKIVKNLFRGALRLCHQYYSSLSKREVTEVFQVSIDKPRNKRRTEGRNYCDYLEQGL